MRMISGTHGLCAMMGLADCMLGICFVLLLFFLAGDIGVLDDLDDSDDWMIQMRLLRARSVSYVYTTFLRSYIRDLLDTYCWWR